MRDDAIAERVLDHAEGSYHYGKCPALTHTGHVENPSCGDLVHVELRLSAAGRIEEAWFQARGCLISRAAASMLVESIEGQMASSIVAWKPQQMLELFGSPLTAKRQMCCLLGLFAVQRALAGFAE